MTGELVSKMLIRGKRNRGIREALVRARKFFERKARKVRKA